ncbi:MAG: sigma-70 family RNA polymerase sigma factor [Candidatus Cloacimonetes bacterium]|nr:sigma-70 family RNA polymerase sigma factor [Candidatus Cloacimonadota bacterium]
MDNFDFTVVQNISFRLAYNKLGRKEDAEDIAQIVLMKLYLNIEKVKPEAVKSWVIQVTKNEIADFCKKNKITFSDQDVETIPDTYLPETHYSEQKKDPVLEEIINDLPEDQKRLINIYFSSGEKIRTIAERENIGYDKLKKLLYRVKKDIYAEYNIRIGFTGTKEIVGARLNENIQRFIKKFKTCIEENNLEKMRIYFGKKISLEEIPEIHIERIHDYTISLLSKNNYRLTLIFFENEKKIPSFLLLDFEIKANGNIKVTELPSVPSKVIAFMPEKMPENVFDMIRKKEKGQTILTEEQIQDIQKNYGTSIAPTAASELKKNNKEDDE